MKATHYLFSWKTGEKCSQRFYYSLRPVNDPKNSIDTSDCATRQGRNIAINRILDMRDPERKGKIEVLRRTDPAQWLKDRKAAKKKSKS
jgi:hypothetical protein